MSPVNNPPSPLKTRLNRYAHSPKDLTGEEEAFVKEVWDNLRAHFSCYTTPRPVYLGGRSESVASLIYDTLWEEGWALDWVVMTPDADPRCYNKLMVSIAPKAR